MPRCPFCKHQNPVHADRCGECGAALTTIDVSRAEENALSAARADASNERDRAADNFAFELQELLRAGNKIAAVKLYRERTGAGLADAKAAVDAIERGEPATADQRQASPRNDFERQLEQLLRGGNMIAAIKLYRERTGKGLKESKDAVEAFARQRNIPLKQIGCGLSALLLVVVAVAWYGWVWL
jgi:ribosomal protein L7/L12